MTAPGEAARERYELLAKQTQQAHDAFDALVTSLHAELAQDDEAIRGFYGKANASGRAPVPSCPPWSILRP
jgi:hypothetical protein